ncbi:hypothetical protein Lal_00027962 [Lupinus albus]|nr:hypothetical protein Lal_00027962 [Lupinus albus]
MKTVIAYRQQPALIPNNKVLQANCTIHRAACNVFCNKKKYLDRKWKEGLQPKKEQLLVRDVPKW